MLYHLQPDGRAQPQPDVSHEQSSAGAQQPHALGCAMPIIVKIVNGKAHVLSDAELAALGDEGGYDDGHEEPEELELLKKAEANRVFAEYFARNLDEVMDWLNSQKILSVAVAGGGLDGDVAAVAAEHFVYQCDQSGTFFTGAPTPRARPAPRACQALSLRCGLTAGLVLRSAFRTGLRAAPSMAGFREPRRQQPAPAWPGRAHARRARGGRILWLR
eukprot:COSAG06_NODE_2895_length_6124_cov_15.907386_2_plen_217_part_00